jgi:hypothetical protein
VEGESSSWLNVLSDVPQGSVLGPLFFIIYINDLPEVVHNHIALFADDAKLFAPVMDDQDQHSMQRDLTELINWSNHWLINFNENKCKVMHLGSNNLCSNYNMDNTELQCTDKERDLGIIVDNRLKLDAHTESQINKASSKLAVIRRSFNYLEPDTFCTLYKSLVRPHLEYCNAITYPRLERQITDLENVQRRATKLVPSLKNLSYIDRLKALNLPTLNYRRNRGDVIEAYKYIHGIYNVSPCPLLLDERVVLTRGHTYKLKKARCNKSVRQHFFVNRVVDKWNQLPDFIVTSPSLNTFKNRLDSFWEVHKFSLDPIH